MMEAPKPLTLSDQGPLLLHAHANGYPPEVYRSFLEPFLKTYQTRAVFLRPFWPGADPGAVRDWRTFRNDYLAALPSHLEAAGGNETLIGMGHSLGAMTTLMAAIEEPEKFRALVLIEPTLFPPWKGFFMRLAAPFHLFRYIHPLVRRTLRRKTSFPDQASMFLNYRNKGVFAKIPDHVLRDYVQGLAAPQADGTVSLKYSPDWEVRIYETGGSADRYVLKNLSKITCPVLVLRGEMSDTLGEKTLQGIARDLPRGKAVTLPSLGHLLPLEAPEQVAAVVLDFLDSVR
jgi:pimeloyl-ACP methyl ester carboxylesterase